MSALFCSKAVLALCFLYSCLRVLHAIENAVTPNDPRPFIGENLTLVCRVTRADRVSNGLFFRVGDQTLTEYQDILDNTTIRLSYPVKSLHDGNPFICYYYNKSYDQRESIGQQFVEVEHFPRAVNTVNCLVYNWKTMTCTWDNKTKYLHPKKVIFELKYWTRSNKVNKIQMNYNQNSYTWIEGDFTQDLNYSMNISVISSHNGTNVTTESRDFTIDTRKIVKPHPVKDVRIVWTNTTCTYVAWSHSDNTHLKMASLLYQSEWDLKWKELPQLDPVEDMNNANFTICNLTPNTNYSIQIAIMPVVYRQLVGNLSDWTTVHTRTNQSAPEVAPTTCNGCFSLEDCTNLNCTVILYWKSIPRRQQYSNITKYFLQLRKNTEKAKGEIQYVENVTTTGVLLYQRLNLVLDHSYSVNLYANTEYNGLSLNYSTLILPAKTERPTEPDSFVVETSRSPSDNEHVYYIRWADDKNTNSYTIFWCRRSETKHVCSEKEEIQWVDIPGGNTKHSFRAEGNPRDYIVGISRQVPKSEISSGIKWAPCIYTRDTVPIRAPTMLGCTPTSPNSLEVLWNRLSCIYGGDQESYVTHYKVFYCMCSSSNICIAPELSITVNETVNKVDLKELTSGQRYCAHVAAMASNGRLGPRSEVAFGVLSYENAEKANSIFIVLITLVGVVIIAIVIWRVMINVRRANLKFQQNRKIMQPKKNMTANKCGIQNSQLEPHSEPILHRHSDFLFGANEKPPVISTTSSTPLLDEVNYDGEGITNPGTHPTHQEHPQEVNPSPPDDTKVMYAVINQNEDLYDYFHNGSRVQSTKDTSGNEGHKDRPSRRINLGGYPDYFKVSVENPEHNSNPNPVFIPSTPPSKTLLINKNEGWRVPQGMQYISRNSDNSVPVSETATGMQSETREKVHHAHASSTSGTETYTFMEGLKNKESALQKIDSLSSESCDSDQSDGNDDDQTAIRISFDQHGQPLLHPAKPSPLVRSTVKPVSAMSGIYDSEDTGEPKISQYIVHAPDRQSEAACLRNKGSNYFRLGNELPASESLLERCQQFDQPVPNHLSHILQTSSNSTHYFNMPGTAKCMLNAPVRDSLQHECDRRQVNASNHLEKQSHATVPSNIKLDTNRCGMNSPQYLAISQIVNVTQSPAGQSPPTARDKKPLVPMPSGYVIQSSLGMKK